MINFSFFESFNETAIIFSNEFSMVAKEIYRNYLKAHPSKNVYLINYNNIICAAKCDDYKSYIIVGTGCPLHRFSNAEYFETELSESEWNDILRFDGLVLFDSIFSTEKYNDKIQAHNNAIFQLADCDLCTEKNEKFNSVNSVVCKMGNTSSCIGDRCNMNTIENCKIMVVTKNQSLFDYYNYKYENVERFYGHIVINNRIRYLMKENINGKMVKESKMFGIIYTSKMFESICENLHGKLNRLGRAYKIFLKDISYERLISIENIDCFVLVDCPLYSCDISVHIPIISPFSVNCWVTNSWISHYDKNYVDEEGWERNINQVSDSKEIIIGNKASELLLSKEYQGVAYKSKEEDIEIHLGKTGIASKYNDE